MPDNTQESRAPEFLKPLHDVETIIGHTVKFRCKVKGYPHPKVLWFKDGKRLKPSDVVKMGKMLFSQHQCLMSFLPLFLDAKIFKLS